MTAKIVHRTLRISLFLLLAAPLICLAAEAEMSNLMINGVRVQRSDRPLFPATSPLEICFSMSNYRYSGPPGEQDYYLLLVAPEGQATASTLVALPLEQIGVIDSRAVTGANNMNLTRCHRMNAPPHEGSFTIYSIIVPFFTSRELVPAGSKDSTLASVAAADRSLVLRHIESNAASKYPLGGFRTGKAANEPAEPSYATYLRVNGKAPVTESIKPGLSPQPAVLSWETRPTGPKFEYRFRTYPDEVDWSPWSTAVSCKVSYLPVGTHSFQLEPKYVDSAGHEQKLPMAYYQFFLERPFVAAPSKGTGAGESAHTPPPTVNYPASEALVLAIAKFNAFQDLPFVTEDAKAMKDVLTKRGFNVSAPPTVVQRQAVLETITGFLKGVMPDSRIIIYLSTHGFVDPDVETRDYLATYDCDPKIPVATCILVQDLESTILGVLQKKNIRHFLLLVDACASGMGVATKSYSFPEAGTLRPGAHVITAGTAEEEARASADGKMSVFTKYLVEGLDGKADTYQDGVITVSELLTYVRWNVANETQSSQTPMLGRLSGSGEMVFQLPPAR
jgi:Caspase domain